MKKALGIFVVGTSLFLTACAKPYNNNPQTRNAMLGGAVLGATIGALSQTDEGDRHDIGKGAIAGAVIGAGAGYAVGR